MSSPIIIKLGDCLSRCVLSRKGVAMDMSFDHKPEDEEELTRIEKAGGAVVDGRVQVSACPFALILESFSMTNFLPYVRVWCPSPCSCPYYS